MRCVGGARTLRVCVDANCLVSGIVSPNGITAKIVSSIINGKISLVVSPDITRECIRIMQKPS
ncbi:MAG: PIN domain-containing protein, partial [Chloroflexi bacterium]|nr:PIN domain-containing protein [Chloroflexota bacterium]